MSWIQANMGNIIAGAAVVLAAAFALRNMWKRRKTGGCGCGCAGCTGAPAGASAQCGAGAGRCVMSDGAAGEQSRKARKETSGVVFRQVSKNHPRGHFYFRL